MMSSRFDPGSTSKILNLSLLRFNERSGSKNLALTKASASQDVDFVYYCSLPSSFVVEVSGNELCHHAGMHLNGLRPKSLGIT